MRIIEGGQTGQAREVKGSSTELWSASTAAEKWAAQDTEQ